MLKTLASSIRGYRVRSVLASVFVIIEVLFEVYIPFLMADIINIGIANSDVDFIIRRGALMIGMAVCSLIFGVLCARCAVVASCGFAKNLRKRLFDRVTDFSFANTDKFTTATLITRLTTDTSNVQQAFQMIIRMMVRSPIMLVAATIMAMRINTELAIVFAFALPALIIALGAIAFTTFPKFKILLKRVDSMNAEVQENLIATRVVKAFVREEHENEQFLKSAEAVRAAQVKAEAGIALGMPIAQFVLYACMIAICYLGGTKIIAGDMLTGDLMSFISYVGQILSSVLMMTMGLVTLVMTRASASRICDVLNEQPDITSEGADGSLTVADGSISFKDVYFSYSKDAENPTLEDIGLTIRSGEHIGIIGGTGSGKTSLVQLIPRLYDVTGGSVSVAGHDVREYTPEHLREGVAMVLQKNVLFSGTIKDNLRWGNQNATDEELIFACKAAAAHDFIMGFENGYDTVLGQGGVNLSGGQKQRLCIARALVKKPRIIIMDDSTSAVDTATDESIRRALDEQLSGTTTITIAQRITSVMDMDRIIVMDDGRIIECGTHDELMERGGIYREVYNSQQKGVA